MRPVESVTALDRLIAASRDEGTAAEVCVLLGLDAGLRAGEALPLRWRDITWGADGGRRRLWIERNRPRTSSVDEAPKSGRERSVALSQRLRDALARLYRERWEPGPDRLVREGVNYWTFREGAWRRITKTADLAGVRFKDLRGTYASQLLTCGISLQYISKQLGRGRIEVTQRHYAKWIGDDDYREPMRLREGEVVADLLARLPADVPTRIPTLEDADEEVSAVYGVTWRPQRDSNPCYRLERAES